MIYILLCFYFIMVVWSGMQVNFHTKKLTVYFFFTQNKDSKKNYDNKQFTETAKWPIQAKISS